MVDDHSRYAYVGALPNQRGMTAAVFLEHALAHFAVQGVRIERVLTDNGSCYRSVHFAAVARSHDVSLKRTGPFRPQTDARPKPSTRSCRPNGPTSGPTTCNEERLAALAAFLVGYNRSRPHGGGLVPASRL